MIYIIILKTWEELKDAILKADRKTNCRRYNVNNEDAVFYKSFVFS